MLWGVFLQFQLAETQKGKKHMQIDFFYFDLDSCGRCKEIDANLQRIIDELGLEVKLVKHKLKGHEDHVEGFGRIISPSIFLDGKDISSLVETSSCAECSRLQRASVNCRTSLAKEVLKTRLFESAKARKKLT